MSILNELWSCSFEPERYPIDPEYRRRQREQSKRADEFLDTLNKEQRQMVYDLEIEENSIRAQEAEALFIHSFRQGALMMLEILRA